MTAPWTICHGCMKPTAVTITERDESNGAGWWYSCPAPCYAHDDDAQQQHALGWVQADRHLAAGEDLAPVPDPLLEPGQAGDVDAFLSTLTAQAAELARAQDELRSTRAALADTRTRVPTAA